MVVLGSILSGIAFITAALLFSYIGGKLAGLEERVTKIEATTDVLIDALNSLLSPVGVAVWVRPKEDDPPTA